MKTTIFFFGLIFLCNAWSVGASDTNELEHATGESLISLGGMGILEDTSSKVTDVDLSHRTVVSIDQKDSLLEDLDYTSAEDTDSYFSADDLSRKLKEKTGEGSAKKKVHILSLATTSMDDATFTEVTDKLIPAISFEDNNGILDLSFNTLTTSSIPQLVRWIDEAHVRFINLHGNPKCSMKYVRDLCKSFKVITQGNSNEVRRLMSHIIFLPNYYIYQAKTQVKIYRQLCEHGYLPDNWDDIQKEFYVLSSKKPVSFPEEVLRYDPDADLSFEE